ncbi:MAG: endonuclease NucS [Candidatus Adiutrix sp.]|jgi:restriction system protein|nr:endonuclease NucS [Candidatus Adiutrix sp.]
MKYIRLMLGRSSIHATCCFEGNFIGADFGIERDLTNELPEEWRAFNAAFIPVYQAARPEKSKIAAGLACGMLWTVCQGMKIGDRVLCPDGGGHYRVGEIIGNYTYAPGQVLPHRRAVRWLEQSIDRAAMSEALRNSCGSIGTVCEISAYQEEIRQLIRGHDAATCEAAGEEAIENPLSFALEKHLEHFLIANWAQTELGKNYDIYEDEGERIGQQYSTDTGPIDILAISKDKRELLVVELKRGRAADAVVGQVLRYMGYVAQELAEAGQTVRGVIIAQEDDQRIRRALAVTPNVSFYRYQVSFKLLPL